MNQREKEQRAARRFLILVAFLIVVLIAVIYLLFFRIRDISLDMAYDKTSSIFGIGKMTQENGRAESFASDLCVSAVDVPLEGFEAPAESAALFNEAEHEVIYAKELHAKRYPASITKIMTTLVALKYGNLDEMVTVGEECKNIEFGSSVCEIHVGDHFTLRQLVYGLMINSGNDAAMTIAVHIAGSVEKFVEMMNQEAADIGASGTHFVNPHGLQDENHYTTAYDLYLVFNKLVSDYPVFIDIINKGNVKVKFKDANGRKKELDFVSTVKYKLNTETAPEGVTVAGGKTGTTQMAGSNLVLYSTGPDGDNYISAVMNASDVYSLYSQMNYLLSMEGNGKRSKP